MFPVGIDCGGEFCDPCCVDSLCPGVVCPSGADLARPYNTCICTAPNGTAFLPCTDPDMEATCGVPESGDGVYWNSNGGTIVLCEICSTLQAELDGCYGCTTVPGHPLVNASTSTANYTDVVDLESAGAYAVLGSSTVTNTGNSFVDGNLGLSPGTSITGFPPGVVLAPHGIHNADGEAGQAQTDLTAAYIDAAGRTITGTTVANLGGLTLTSGVYHTTANGPLSITGTLTLDGTGDPNSVFIFITDSTLTTAGSSVVTLTNGAQECRVFWAVGSSATLGTSSTFVGSILAVASITATTGANVNGRLLASGAAVTLDTNNVTLPECGTGVTVGACVYAGNVSSPVTCLDADGLPTVGNELDCVYDVGTNTTTCFGGCRIASGSEPDGLECFPPCASCSDGIENGDELGIDCGGSCPPC